MRSQYYRNGSAPSCSFARPRSAFCVCVGPFASATLPPPPCDFEQ